METAEGTRTGAQRAYDHTKDAILTGRMRGGVLLSEAVVGAELGISRTPVHEAFLRLQSEGLITLSSRRGAVVEPISAREARDVLEMREAIEASAARSLSAGTIANGALDRRVTDALAAALADQERSRAARDPAAFAVADDAFHSIVIHASGNALAEQFFSVLRDRQQRLRHHLFAVDPALLDAALAEHIALRDALVAADADEYAAVLRTHIDRHEGAL